MSSEIDETLPDVVKDFLRSGAQLEKIHLDAAGKWTHEGLDFENPRIISLFSRSVRRTPGGTWVLEIGRFTYPIEVEDTGYFVERVDLSGAEPRVLLSDDTWDRLVLDSLAYRDEGKLYCEVKDGAFRARFKRSAYYHLADCIEPTEGGFQAVVSGHAYPLRMLDSVQSH